MMKLTVILGALALTLAGCNNRSAAAAQPAATGAQPAAAPVSAGGSAVGDDQAVPRLAVGTKAKCAVSGEDFTVKANTVQVTYAGKRFAFCCADCQPTFAKNPAKYAN